MSEQSPCKAHERSVLKARPRHAFRQTLPALLACLLTLPTADRTSMPRNPHCGSSMNRSAGTSGAVNICRPECRPRRVPLALPVPMLIDSHRQIGSHQLNGNLMGWAWPNVQERTLSFINLNGEPSSWMRAGLAKHWQSQWHPAFCRSRLVGGCCGDFVFLVFKAVEGQTFGNSILLHLIS